MYGTCLYSSPRGRYYSGYFKNSYPTLENNSFHGYGKITYENGSYYEGIFRDGCPTEFGWLIDIFGNKMFIYQMFVVDVPSILCIHFARFFVQFQLTIY